MARALPEKKVGVLVVDTHPTALSPLNAMNSLSRKKGLRSVPAYSPIRDDRTPPGLIPLARKAGFELKKTVTPDMYQEVLEELRKRKASRGEINAHKEAYRKLRETHKNTTREKLANGEAVVLAYKAHRQEKLTHDRFGVVSGTVTDLLMDGFLDFGIHFTAWERPGLTDYSKVKGIRKNLFRSHTVRHGATFTGRELLEMAIPEGATRMTEDEVRKAVFNFIDKLVYNELERVSPKAFLLPKPPAGGISDQDTHMPTSSGPNLITSGGNGSEGQTNEISIEPIIADLQDRFKDRIDPEKIVEIVSEINANARVKSFVKITAQREIEKQLSDDATRDSLEQPPTLK